MKLLRLAALAGALALAACASFTGDGVLTATRFALTTYANVYQPAVIAYGRLPDCADPDARVTVGPAVAAAVFCYERPMLEKLKAADRAAVAAINAVRPVLDGKVPDDGQIGRALQAIQEAEATIAKSDAFRAPQ